MKASLRSVRIAPKKANLVASMIRGLRVLEAIDLLENTNKKAARLLEELLKSAVANAKQNEKQDPQDLIIKSLIVNKAQAYHRGVPMARGRVRPMRKFLSHISVTLGVDTGDDEPKSAKKTEKTAKASSQPAKKQVKTPQSSKAESKTTATSNKSSKGASASKAETTASDSESTTSKKSDSSSPSA